MATGKPLRKITNVTAANADGTYGAEEAALINALKAKINELLAAMRERGWVDR